MGLTYFLKKCIKYFGDIMKINEGSLTDNNIVLDTLEVFLDNTTFYILSGYGAFAMCGALNVDVYNTPKMASRGVLAIRAVGVHSLLELYDATIVEVTDALKEKEIKPGICVKDAFKILSCE